MLNEVVCIWVVYLWVMYGLHIGPWVLQTQLLGTQATVPAYPAAAPVATPRRPEAGRSRPNTWM